MGHGSGGAALSSGPRAKLASYLLAEKLATGGMGEVWVACSVEQPAAPVALKLLRAELCSDEEAVSRFLDEAKLAARLHHPNVVRVLDVGLDAGRYFLALELVRGVSLSRLLGALRASKRQLPAEVLVYLAHGLCLALDHAHGLAGPEGTPLGLVHRDVTPHNLLVSPQGEVKLADFGIARVTMSADRTAPGVVHGKLDYLAPELLQGELAAVRTDLYSAGVTLFTLAALRTPFESATASDLANAILSAPTPDLAQARPDLPAALSLAIARAMARDPKARFPSARAFAEALPPAPPGAAQALAAITQSLCAEDLRRIESAALAAQRAAELAAGEREADPLVTQPSPAVPAGPRTEENDALDAQTHVVAVPSAPPKRRRVWAGLALVLAGLGLAPLGLGALGVLPQGPIPAGAGDAGMPAETLAAAQAVEPAVPPPTLDPGMQAGDGGAVADAGMAEDAGPAGAAPVLAAAVQGDGGEAADAGQGVEDDDGALSRTSPRKKTGRLTIHCQPQARVRIDGREVGNTPLSKLRVPAGTVMVSFETKAGKKLQRKVRVQAGRAQTLRVDLR